VDAYHQEQEHLQLEIGVVIVLAELGAAQHNSAADHNDKADALPNLQLVHYIGDAVLRHRQTEQTQIGHQNHSAEHRDAREVCRQNDRINKRRFPHSGEKPRILDRIGN